MGFHVTWSQIVVATRVANGGGKKFATGATERRAATAEDENIPV